MGSVLELTSVKQTVLWLRLNSGFTGKANQELAFELANKIPGLCDLATQRIKIFPYYHLKTASDRRRPLHGASCCDNR